MVNDRLGIICINCGNNEEFEWIIESETDDEPFKFLLKCINCTTIHNITEKYPEEQ